MAQARANPWSSYKVKLGGGRDIDTIALLRRELPPFTVLNVDANAGWAVEEAFAKTRALLELDVGFIEQPLPPENREHMRQLRNRFSPAERQRSPFIADEACQTEHDVEACAGRYDAVNIKLTKCGGPTAARRMVRRARELGLRVMFGCMVESSVGIGVLRHFAPAADYIDLDGHLLIANDLATGITFDGDGRPGVPEGAGSGVRLLSDWSSHTTHDPRGVE